MSEASSGPSATAAQSILEKLRAEKRLREEREAEAEQERKRVKAICDPIDKAGRYTNREWNKPSEVFYLEWAELLVDVGPSLIQHALLSRLKRVAAPEKCNPDRWELAKDLWELATKGDKVRVAERLAELGRLTPFVRDEIDASTAILCNLVAGVEPVAETSTRPPSEQDSRAETAKPVHFGEAVKQLVIDNKMPPEQCKLVCLLLDPATGQPTAMKKTEEVMAALYERPLGELKQSTEKRALGQAFSAQKRRTQTTLDDNYLPLRFQTPAKGYIALRHMK
jgi:hypothetical protein